MKGLILKDYYLLREKCALLFIEVVLWLIVSMFSNHIFFSVFPCVQIGVLTVTLNSYDEREKWNIYSGTLPYTRAQLVSVKYIMGIILGALVTFLAVLFQAARMVFITSFSKGDIVSLTLSLGAVSIVPSALMLPFVYKFGVEKGRLAYKMMIGVIIGVGILCAYLNLSLNISDKTGNVFLAAAAAVVIYVLSWLLSIVIYKKREI